MVHYGLYTLQLQNQSRGIHRGETIERGLKKFGVTVSKPVLALIAIIFGILVIVFSDLLQWIAGLYFIRQGALFFVDYLELRKG